jgi:hypothetical protein
MQGQGRFQFASGAVYMGAWLANKYEGFGRYTWPDGKHYEVGWHGGSRRRWGGGRSARTAPFLLPVRRPHHQQPHWQLPRWVHCCQTPAQAIERHTARGLRLTVRLHEFLACS